MTTVVTIIIIVVVVVVIIIIVIIITSTVRLRGPVMQLCVCLCVGTIIEMTFDVDICSFSPYLGQVPPRSRSRIKVPGHGWKRFTGGKHFWRFKHVSTQGKSRPEFDTASK